MKKRLVFKPWVEKVLTIIFMFSFVLMVSVNDFYGFRGFIVYLLIIATTVVTGALLNEYGRGE